jgi:hypothetical protein
MRRPAVLLLILLLMGSIAPFARAAFDNAVCCCPDGSASCPVHESSSCSWKSGCGSEHEATTVPLAVFSLPPEAHGLTLAPAKEFDGELLVSTVSRAVPVPDPPPRA